MLVTDKSCNNDDSAIYFNLINWSGHGRCYFTQIAFVVQFIMRLWKWVRDMESLHSNETVGGAGTSNEFRVAMGTLRVTI